jgi:8-oxo-dGTP pyrophosphatase MutT (NUDIX family)
MAVRMQPLRDGGDAMVEMMRTISVTVAAVVEQEGRFLTVEEQTDEGIRINQPAGHLEPGESIVQGVIRETLEESAYPFKPHGLVGVYRWQHPGKDLTYLRFAFYGEVGAHRTELALDHGILRAVWLRHEELQECASVHRSPLVLRCVEDYLAGRRFPLDVLVDWT